MKDVTASEPGHAWLSPGVTEAIGLDSTDCCTACGAHIADPHSPYCPAAGRADYYDNLPQR